MKNFVLSNRGFRSWLLCYLSCVLYLVWMWTKDEGIKALFELSRILTLLTVVIVLIAVAIIPKKEKNDEVV